MQDSTQKGAGLDQTDTVLVALLRSSGGELSARELLEGLAAQGIKISQSTLSRRMTALQSSRHVIAHLAGKNTVYSRDPYHDWFELPPSRRSKVPYNFDVLASYEPNFTQWLAPEDIERLNRAGGHGRPDASTYSRAISQKLMVELSYGSSLLEGNTYSYLDTQVLVEYGQAAEGKAAQETQMILNHKDAVVYLVENINDIDISVREICALHALLSQGLLNPVSVGTVRTKLVDIGGSSYVPLTIPQQISGELDLLASKANQITNPFEQSFFLMTMISYLQAFLDVNKRTGRLACNIPLLKNGLAPLSFMEMNKVRYVQGLLAFYELNRVDLLKEAYVDGYLSSAARYDIYVDREVGDIQLEIRRRSDIQQCLKTYVDSSVAAGKRLDPVKYALEQFEKDPADVRAKLVKRISETVDAMNEATCVAYGISRSVFGEFEKLAL